MPTTYDLNPRDVALYQRSNEYLSRLNALDPYSREYANVYNDYVDTIDQLSNRDFRASLGSTLLEFAPMTRPRVQPRASEPVQLAPADNILYRNRPTNQQEVSSPVPISPRNTSPLTVMALGQNMSSGSPEDIPQELASMYRNSKAMLPEVTPYGITVHNPYWNAYPYTSAESQPKVESQPRNKNYALSFINTTDGPYGPMVPFLQAARTYAQGNSSKEQAEPKSTVSPQAIDPPPMMIEGSLPLVGYSNNTTLSPFAHSSSYAEALSRLSWPGQVIPITNDWYQ